jgi:hypothetical protein
MTHFKRSDRRPEKAQVFSMACGVAISLGLTDFARFGGARSGDRGGGRKKLLEIKGAVSLPEGKRNRASFRFP